MDNSGLYKNLCKFREETYKIFLQKKRIMNSVIPEISSYDEHYLELISKLGKSNISAFSDLANISRPAGTKVVKKFLEKGYVKKTLNEEDNREYLIELSPCVEDYIKESERLFSEIFDDKLSVLSKEELEELTRIMEKIVDENNL